MTKGEMLALGEVAQVAVTITNIDASTNFYRDTLGLNHMFTAGNMAFFDCGNLRLLLGLAEDGKQATGGSVLYFRVSDIEAAHNALVANEVQIERPPTATHRTEEYELWLAFFRDPDGNLLALFEERATG